MFNDLYKSDNELIVPSAQLVKQIGARMQAEIDNPAPLKSAFPFGKIAAIAACVCIVIAAGVILPRLLSNNNQLVSKGAETTAAATGAQNEPTVAADGFIAEDYDDALPETGARPTLAEDEDVAEDADIESAERDEAFPEEAGEPILGFAAEPTEKEETASETTPVEFVEEEEPEAFAEEAEIEIPAEDNGFGGDNENPQAGGNFDEEEVCEEEEAVADSCADEEIIELPLPEAKTFGELLTAIGTDLTSANLTEGGYAVLYYPDSYADADDDEETQHVDAEYPCEEEAIIDFSNGKLDRTPILEALQKALGAPSVDSCSATEFQHLYFDAMTVDIANTEVAIVSCRGYSGRAYFKLPEGTYSTILELLKSSFNESVNAETANTENAFVPSGNYSDFGALLTDMGIGGKAGIESCFTSYTLPSEGITGPGSPVSEYEALYDLLSKHTASPNRADLITEKSDSVYFDLTAKNTAMTVTFWKSRPEIIEVQMNGKAYQFDTTDGAFEEALIVSKNLMGIATETARAYATLGEMLDDLDLMSAGMSDIFSPTYTDSEQNYEYWLYIARGNEQKIADIIFTDKSAKHLDAFEESDHDMIYIGTIYTDYYIEVFENDVMKIGSHTTSACDNAFTLPKGTYNKLLAFIKKNGTHASGNFNTDIMVEE